MGKTVMAYSSACSDRGDGRDPDPSSSGGPRSLSTCGRQLGANVVNDGPRYLVFVTRRGGRRTLTGYHRMRGIAVIRSVQKAPDDTPSANRLRLITLPPLMS